MPKICDSCESRLFHSDSSKLKTFRLISNCTIFGRAYRFTRRVFGAASSLVVGSMYGGLPGALVAGSATSLEYIYDGIVWFGGEVEKLPLDLIMQGETGGSPVRDSMNEYQNHYEKSIESFGVFNLFSGLYRGSSLFINRGLVK